MSSSEAIIREIGNKHGPPRECVACSTEVTPLDIATQSVKEPSAGMHCCQTCLPVDIEDIAPSLNEVW